MKTLLSILCALHLLNSASLYAAAGTPRLSFDTTAVLGAGFTPSGQVVVFGYSNQPQPYTRRLMNFWKVVTADSGGAFRWETPEPVANHSVWFAVGSSSRDLVVGVPGDGDVSNLTLAAPTLLAGQDSGGDALSVSEYMAEVVVVRPNDTAWRGTAIRHGTGDLSRGQSGAHKVSLASLTTVGSTTRVLNRITPADVVVIVEPVSLRFWAGRLLPN
jgi:hypothetical protein